MEEIKTTKTSWLHFILTTIAVFGPLLYLIGLSYYLGLLSTYGVDSDIYEISIQDTYFAGYVAVFQLLLNLKDFIIETLFVWNSIWFLGLLFFSVVILLLFIIYKDHVLECPFLLWFKPIFSFLNPTKPSIGRAITLGSLATFLVANFIFICATIFSLWGLPSILGYSVGKTVAEKTITSYLEKGCHFEQNKRWSNCKILQSSDGKVLYEGIVIANSDTRIAFFTKSGAIVANLPEDAVIINTPNLGSHNTKDNNQ